jgi:hypothetical protein
MTRDDDDPIARVEAGTDELVERTRIASLTEAREEAADAIREAPLRRDEARRRRGGRPEAVAEHVRSAVAAYALECEPVLKNTPEGRNLWGDRRLGPIPLPDPPGGRWREGPTPTVTNVAGELVGDGVVAVPGVGAYVELPTPICVDWEGRRDAPGLGRGVETATETTEVRAPVRLSERVFRNLNKLLADLGLGLDVETDDDPLSL